MLSLFQFERSNNHNQSGSVPENYNISWQYNAEYVLRQRLGINGAVSEVSISAETVKLKETELWSCGMWMSSENDTIVFVKAAKLRFGPGI